MTNSKQNQQVKEHPQNAVPPPKEEEANISHSIAHYLMAIEQACANSSDDSCKAADVARDLKVSRNAVSLRLKSMKQNDLINISADKKVSLTTKGSMIVNNVITAKKATKRFLINFLGVTEEVAEEDSCQVEHLISQQTRTGLLKLIQFVEEQPEISKPFIKALKKFNLHCSGNTAPCPLCHQECVITQSDSV